MSSPGADRGLLENLENSPRDRTGSLKAAAEEVGVDVVNFPVDEEWLALAHEEALLPDLPIVDPHHHMWDRVGYRYMPPDLLGDLNGGHNVVATVYIEAGAMYRSKGPAALRPVGETEIVAAIADGWPGTADARKICAGIVAHADFTVGAGVEELLVKHLEVGRGHLRGIRQNAAWDPAPSIQLPPLPPRGPIQPGLLTDSRFREGFSRLAPLGLSFDAWLYQPQLPELLDLARKFPETQIIVDHVGGPVRTGPYRGRSDELSAEWSALMGELAQCPNVTMKIGGLGMRTLGFDFREKKSPPHSEALAVLWKPFVEGCIEAFGADRCMFESNFPVDKGYYSYNACWNAFKRLTVSASDQERDDLFRRTAARVYRLAI